MYTKMSIAVEEVIHSRFSDLYFARSLAIPRPAVF